MYQPVDPRPIPIALEAHPNWVCWREELRGEKPTKVPVEPGTGRYASVADPDTWTSLDTAYQYYRDRDWAAGIGYVFTPDDPFLGVDLDDCRDSDTGALDDWARDIVQQLDSYTEASPSGTGVHVIAAAELPSGGNRSGSIELYDRDRYFTVTGHHLDLTPTTINDRMDEVAAVHDEYVADRDTGRDTSRTTADDAPTNLSNDELIQQALAASNGDKFEQLWNGDTTGYPTHSEADLALCNILAFWTGGDPQQMERLFEHSGLVREKWLTRPDYRELTIKKAIEDCPAYYSP